MSDIAECGNSWLSLTRWMHHPDVVAARRAAELAAADGAAIAAQDSLAKPLTYQQRATLRRMVAAEAAYMKAKLTAIAIDLEAPVENC